MADTVETTDVVEKPVKRADGFTWGTGRRKSSIARVRVKEGSGKVTVNGRKVEDYFSEHKDRNAVTAPLDIANLRGQYDIFANASGGGITGQAFAIRLGLARAVIKLHPEVDGQLRDAGYLTRDSRMKERKKYGQKGARKRFQFSKR